MIVFVLVPGLYSAVEQADNPALRGRPVVVGADPAKRGTVTSASREARARGVDEGMEMRRALELCPDAVIRPTRLERYREVAAELRALLRAETDRIEELGLEGTFLELGPSVDPVARAAELCVRVQAELGIGAVAGIGPTRFVAYLGARHAGPGGIRQVAEADVKSFLAPIPVTEIWGVGPATAERLAARGVHTIATLAAVDIATLTGVVGRGASAILEYARRADRQPPRPKPPPRSLSPERTPPQPSAHPPPAASIRAFAPSHSCRSRASTRARRSRTRSTSRSAASASSASASRSTWARRCAFSSRSAPARSWSRASWCA